MNLDILRTTWATAAGYGDRFTATFYAGLFLRHPELRDLFGTDMADQRKKLAETLDLVVAGADNIEAVVPRLRKLGRMHRRFGVTPEMYPAVGEALLATFARFLGDEWTAEAADTWGAAYTVVAGVMVDAHNEADRYAEPAFWDVLVLGVSRSDDGAVLRISLDPDAGVPWRPGEYVPVRLADRAGTWRLFQLNLTRPEILVPVGERPDGVTLDLLTVAPGDHLWVAAPVDAIDDQEVTL
jgi:hemoglobin-like flavoprotein